MFAHKRSQTKQARFVLTWPAALFSGNYPTFGIHESTT